MTDTPAPMAQSLSTRLDLLFGARLKRPPQGVHVAHGRLVLLGEHVDHQGGFALTVPQPEGVACAWAVRPDSRVAVWAINAKAKDHFTQGEWIKKGRKWSDMARGTCKAVCDRLDRRLPGLDLMILGDLQTQQGLASSAAMTIAMMKCLYQVAEEELDPRLMAQDAAKVEHEWGGVACGLMDPFTAAVGKPGEVLHINCANLAHEVLALPDRCALDSEDTGVRRPLHKTPYNQRRKELLAALRALHARDPSIRRLPHVRPEVFAQHAEHIPEPGRARAQHVIDETQRVAAGVEALKAGDKMTLGRLMNQCHESLSTLFENSTPEIDQQVAELQQGTGVYGARLQGAGWGGRIAVLHEVSGDEAGA